MNALLFFRSFHETDSIKLIPSHHVKSSGLCGLQETKNQNRTSYVLLRAHIIPALHAELGIFVNTKMGNNSKWHIFAPCTFPVVLRSMDSIMLINNLN